MIEVGCSKLIMEDLGEVDILNLKCEPLLIGSLRMQLGFYPVNHMNKKNWISVLLDGPEPDDELKDLIALSYRMTSKSFQRIEKGQLF